MTFLRRLCRFLQPKARITIDTKPPIWPNTTPPGVDPAKPPADPDPLPEVKKSLDELAPRYTTVSPEDELTPSDTSVPPGARSHTVRRPESFDIGTMDDPPPTIVPPDPPDPDDVPDPTEVVTEDSAPVLTREPARMRPFGPPRMLLVSDLHDWLDEHGAEEAPQALDEQPEAALWYRLACVAHSLASDS